MKRAPILRTALLLVAFAAIGSAAQPIIGVWQLDHQELNGVKKESEQLTLRISPDGDKFLFSFAVPVNNIDFVSLTYTAKFDGSEADVKNRKGDKVGTVEITSPVPAHYKMVLKRPNRPDNVVNLSVATDGKTLTSDSNSTQAGQPVHLVQTFLRH